MYKISRNRAIRSVALSSNRRKTKTTQKIRSGQQKNIKTVGRTVARTAGLLSSRSDDGTREGNVASSGRLHCVRRARQIEKPKTTRFWRRASVFRRVVGSRTQSQNAMDDKTSGGDGRNHPYVRHGRTDPATMPSTSKIFHDNSDRSKDVIDVGQRLLVGNVKQVLRWSQMLSFLEPTKFIYQVFGVIDSVKTGSNKCEKIFRLRSEHKNLAIVCVFYEIDRKMPSVLKGTLVLCTGHVKGVNKLQIFTIRQLQENDRNSFDRISLVSQWAVNDILIYKKV